MINDAWLAVEPGRGLLYRGGIFRKDDVVAESRAKNMCYLAEYKHAKIAILTVHLRRLCGLMSNYFDHLLSFAVDKQKK